MHKIVFFLSMMVCCLFCSCNRPKEYVIGVSQCSNDGWRQKVNSEIKIGRYQYENVEIHITSADNNSQRQIAQIDSLVQLKVDLLVVAPNDIETVAPAIERAYRSGTPVVLYDRRIDSPHFTAYIGSDNTEVGKTMAEFVASKLNNKGTILEITGKQSSSPAIERHRGFMQIMQHYPDVRVITRDGQWDPMLAENIIGDLLDRGVQLDGVFAHNDALAMGAYRAAQKRGKERDMIFVGIDGLPGPGEGIDDVRKGYLTGSFIYPTRGESIVTLAMNILERKPYKRINHLKSSIVTQETADIATLQNEELKRQAENLNNIYASIDRYMAISYNQRNLILMFAALFVLLIAAIAAIYRAYAITKKANHKIKEVSDDRLNLFTNISHELRTPLTLIKDPLECSIAEGSIRGENLKRLQLAMDNVNILTKLVNDIMDLRKSEEAKMRLTLSSFDLRDLTAAVIDAYQSTAKTRHLDITLTASQDHDYAIVADQDKVMRIITNLLSNAIKYTPSGKSITVTLGCPDNEHVALEVKDTGVGMDKDDVSRVFEQFFQAKNAVGGTGIGLALSKAFTELHHGQLYVESEKGQGTTFTVLLPRLQPSASGTPVEAKPVDIAEVEPLTLQYTNSNDHQENAKDQMVVSQDDNDKPTILVVDDNNEMRKYLKSVMGTHYQVVEASDGQSGLTMATSTVPDLVVSDVMMPEMNGLEFCNRLKTDPTTCHIPVLLLTARTLESQEIEGYEHGADAYITKPFTSRLVLARIDNLLKGRKMLRNVFSGTSTERQEEQQQLNSHDQVFIQSLRQAIQANLSNPQLKIEDLGEKVGLGRVQLYRKVKALTGSTPVELLRLARLERGRQLLKTTDMTISQVAYEVGFATPSYFTTCFKQQYGMYPNDVRI